ncbi:MAG: hypothetical protein PVH19_03875 [Planctomycetia bacterium]|jgi:hypothetical protein
MNRSTHNLILIISLLTLGTLGLIGTSIVDAITLNGGHRSTDASVWLLVVFIIQIALGVILIFLQSNDLKKIVMPSKENNKEDKKDPS